MAERVELAPFGRHHLVALPAGILGDPPDEATVDDVLDRSEGNAFLAGSCWPGRRDRRRHAAGRAREALANQMLVADPDRDARAFGHALVRGGGPRRRAARGADRLHAAIAATLEARPEADRGAIAAYGFAEAQRHLERALELWERVPDAAGRAAAADPVRAAAATSGSATTSRRPPRRGAGGPPHRRPAGAGAAADALRRLGRWEERSG